MMKKVIAIIAFVIVASLSVAGCITTTTESPNTPSPTNSPSYMTPTYTPIKSSPTPIPTSSGDLSSYITAKFSEDYLIVKQFKKSTNSYGNVVYTGVVKDNEKKLYPYSHNVTIELTKNRDATKTRYAQWKTYLLSSGLIKEFDYGDYMTFYDGSQYTHPNREAYLDMNEPSLINHIYNTGVFLSLGDTFMVTADITTKL